MAVESGYRGEHRRVLQAGPKRAVIATCCNGQVVR
jgi:hypothetical protein